MEAFTAMARREVKMTILTNSLEATDVSFVHQHHGAPEAGRRKSVPPGAPPQHHGSPGHQDHNQHTGHSVEMFRNRFWISLALTIRVRL